jgi:hypothetical protein
MKKISKVDAYQALDEMDFKVMDQELESVFNSDQRGNREMNHQFFLDNDGYIVLEMYWDGEKVHSLSFENKGVLTDEGRKVIGRPSLGTTKKVSLTLPERVWEKIDERKEDEGLSQSQAIKEMLEHACHFPKDTASLFEKEKRFTDFKNFVLNADLSKLQYHLFKFGLVILSSVEKVEPKYNNEGIEVHFNGGNLTIWKDNIVSKCHRPSNLLIDCEVCYSLCNEYEEHIGYLYIKKEKGENK